MGLQSGDSVGVLHQLMPFSSKNCEANLDVCFGSIVLHKMRWTTGIHLINERLQCILENMDIHGGIHFAFKDADSSWSSHTYPSPHMHLQWVLGSTKTKYKHDAVTVYSFAYLQIYTHKSKIPWLIFQSFSLHSATEPTVTLHLY